MNAQVLITSTSASSAREVISIPRSKTLPSMISASTRFLAQPRLIMPTLVLIFRMRERCLLNGDFTVTFADWLAVFANLDRLAVEHAHCDMLATKFDRPIRRRNPAFVFRSLRRVIHDHFDVRFLQRLDIDARLARLGWRRR